MDGERRRDGAREWASPQFTGSLSCFQLVVSAKGIKDEMNNMIWGACGRTGGRRARVSLLFLVRRARRREVTLRKSCVGLCSGWDRSR